MDSNYLVSFPNRMIQFSHNQIGLRFFFSHGSWGWRGWIHSDVAQYKTTRLICPSIQKPAKLLVVESCLILSQKYIINSVSIHRIIAQKFQPLPCGANLGQMCHGYLNGTSHLIKSHSLKIITKPNSFTINNWLNNKPTDNKCNNSKVYRV